MLLWCNSFLRQRFVTLQRLIHSLVQVVWQDESFTGGHWKGRGGGGWREPFNWRIVVNLEQRIKKHVSWIQEASASQPLCVLRLCLSHCSTRARRNAAGVVLWVSVKPQREDTQDDIKEKKVKDQDQKRSSFPGKDQQPCVWVSVCVCTLRAQEAHADWGGGNETNVFKYFDCDSNAWTGCPTACLPGQLVLQVLPPYSWKPLKWPFFDEILKYVAVFNLCQKVSLAGCSFHSKGPHFTL